LIHIFEGQPIVITFLIILYLAAVDLIDYLVEASKCHNLAFVLDNFQRAWIFFLKVLRIIPSFVLILNLMRLGENTVFIDIILNGVIVNALVGFYWLSSSLGLCIVVVKIDQRALAVYTVSIFTGCYALPVCVFSLHLILIKFRFYLKIWSLGPFHDV